jgi:serine protease inhibitor
MQAGVRLVMPGEATAVIRIQRTMVFGAVLAVAGCAAPAPPELFTANGVERVAVDRAAFREELAAFRTSAFTLGDALLAGGGEGNVVSSPGSLLVALAMLRAGASGEAAAEMDAVLGFPAANRDEAMNALLASLQQFDGDPGSVDESNPPSKPLIHAANGLFVDKNIPTGEVYLQTLAKQYGTGVYPVDFRDEAATKPAMDTWVNRNTGGRIKKAPAAFDPDNTFSLLNAVYFAGAWKMPFSANSTSEEPFTKADGVKVTVPMMHGLQDMAYAEGAGWQAVDLPYGEGFVMRLVLPDAGADAADGFGPEKLTSIAEALEAASPEGVQLSLPPWDHRSDFDLREVMGALELSKTLATSQDFNSIQYGMRLTQAAQAANITVAEKGTIAAAVTQINAEAVSGRVAVSQRSITFDRPFHYQIVHVESGLPLFMGKVADPR